MLSDSRSEFWKPFAKIMPLGTSLNLAVPNSIVSLVKESGSNRLLRKWAPLKR